MTCRCACVTVTQDRALLLLNWDPCFWSHVAVFDIIHINSVFLILYSQQKSFRSRKRLYVTTDGGLLKTQGTHGWVISNGSTVLFRCAGPVDGPFDTSSSTRCELSGYASVLLFIDHLSLFWGIRHKCKFTWICDSRAAISRVRRFATRHPSRRMPADVDLISIIRTHLASIKCKFKHRWIKGHQDSSSTRNLSAKARLNIEADSLGCLWVPHTWFPSISFGMRTHSFTTMLHFYQPSASHRSVRRMHTISCERVSPSELFTVTETLV
jgi:hypothetical protein